MSPFLKGVLSTDLYTQRVTHQKELESSILAWNYPLMNNECFRELTEELNEWIRRVGIDTNGAKAVVAGLGAHLPVDTAIHLSTVLCHILGVRRYQIMH